ncbi:dihydrolipoamide acetyltransferase family protein [Microbacterium pseudoresistens]|uniref:Dihydrolipoamide acetyltransferase component of pyruvate dehydrogenase complex n=1 Tax=Microbacterium pseudoresistens TaxID=640634 RepID=A0A7Y9EWS7_9MICO|nr:dihydrolipoamide acetyltransferase family protein [Microbacterium pseudoresistens]NYD55397.1 pyruvate dehydrogenase E2 component (dihydrolipoamide acetyltransferase) [Microbacterium pseudoresistens]
MKQEFRLPDLGEGLAEADIVQWLVAEGDEVELNQTLAEVETAKAVVELPSPFDGTVAVLHAAAGDTVEVGAPLIDFDVAGDEPEPRAVAAQATMVDAEEAGEDDAAQPNLVGYGAAPRGRNRPARRARRVNSAPHTSDTSVLEAAPHDAVVTAEPVLTGQERPRSTPPVRAYAKSLGVDLALVAAELGDRVITRTDVDDYRERVGVRESDTISRESRPDPSLRSHTGSDARPTVRIPVRGVRKHTAEAMVRSAFSAPHVTTFHTVDVTATMELVASLRADKRIVDARDGSPLRIGVLAIVAKAVCLALPAYPGLNSTWDEESGEIVQNGFVDLGIAAATDRGLIVPVLRDAQRLSLTGLAEQLGDLTATARSGKTAPADLLGGNFSLTNIGVFGVEAGTPILPPGQTGILATGAVRKTPWEHEGQIALRDVMTLSLSFDHRIVDGAEGAQFLRAVADVLQEPGRAMLLG